MTKKPIFRGCATALITPFSEGEVDYPALSALIEEQCKAGIRALVICGTTGEASALSAKEHTAITAFAREHTPRGIPVIAGCGSPSTEHALSLVREAASAGADSVLVVTPYYNKCTQEGLYRHYSLIADTSPVPLILYEVPGRTGVRVDEETYLRLSKNENIAGLKDASGSVEHTARIRALCGDALPVYSGNDGLNVPLFSLGAVGMISVLSGLIPETVQHLWDLWENGKAAEAGALQCRLSSAVDALFSSVNPIPVKTVLAALGFCREEFRLPLCPLSPEERSVLMQKIHTAFPDDQKNFFRFSLHSALHSAADC